MFTVIITVKSKKCELVNACMTTIFQWCQNSNVKDDKGALIFGCRKLAISNLNLGGCSIQTNTKTHANAHTVDLYHV